MTSGSELCVHQLVISESATELPSRTADRPTSRARAPTVGAAGPRKTAGPQETGRGRQPGRVRPPSRVRLAESSETG